jgi:hypothetical protein
VFYIALKVRNRRWWVELHPVYVGALGLGEVLNRLERNAQPAATTDMEAQELDEVDEQPGHVRLDSV